MHMEIYLRDQCTYITEKYIFHLPLVVSCHADSVGFVPPVFKISISEISDVTSSQRGVNGIAFVVFRLLQNWKYTLKILSMEEQSINIQSDLSVLS